MTTRGILLMGVDKVRYSWYVQGHRWDYRREKDGISTLHRDGNAMPTDLLRWPVICCVDDAVLVSIGYEQSARGQFPAA